MRKVIVEDTNGYKKAFWVKDDAETIEYGIPDLPPDLNRLNWDEIKQDLHNQLVMEGFTTWQDVQRRQDVFQGIVLAVVRNKIINLYKIVDQEVKNVQQYNASKDGIH